MNEDSSLDPEAIRRQEEAKAVIRQVYLDAQIEAVRWVLKTARFFGTGAILTNLHAAIRRLERGKPLEGEDA